MKKFILSLLSVVLCVCLVLPTTAAAKATDSAPDAISTEAKTELMKTTAKAINIFSNTLINIIGKMLNLVIPQTPAIQSYRKFDLAKYDNFYKGMDKFLDEPAEGAKWSLGYAEESIMPADFGTKPYTMGGYGLMATTTEKFDDLYVRTIVMNDGTGRGNVVFAVLDAIGIANADVRLVRAALKEVAKENNIVSLNISVTHTHSGIDLQGVWHNTLPNVLSNLFLGSLHLKELQSGVDRTFLNTIIAQTKKSVEEACDDLQVGTLTLAKKDLSGYMRDRTAPYCFDENVYRLTFTPDEASATPTIIATYGTHPENSGYGHTVISADFIPSTEEVLNKAGYNFIFIQGAIGTITYARGNSDDGLDLTRHEEAVRYGYEMGYMLLSFTSTEKECAELNDRLGDLLGVNTYSDKEGYSVWYKDWQPVEEETVDPLLNIAHKQYIIPVSNVLMDIVGKSGIVDYLFLYDFLTGKYYSVTECGYMELGDSLKVEICPGETYGELLKGGDGLKGFKYDALRDMFGENLIVFDLMNDAIGYIEPDPEFVMAGVQYSEKNEEFDTDTWCLISFGKNTASKVIGEFKSLVESVR